MRNENFIDQLVTLSRRLGSPGKEYVILGEGNVSGKVDDKIFWVKASGTSLATLTGKDLVQVYFEPVNALIKEGDLDDGAIQQGLQQARVDSGIAAMPSVETFLHAILLQLVDVKFVGHTHPTSVNSILCSVHAQEAFSGSLFPDQIVYCGRRPLYIPYTDPGLTLAKMVDQQVNSYMAKWGETPKIILMQNHGLIALGKTTSEVEQITAMSVKAAEVILGTYIMGGPHFLSEKNVGRIDTRLDEQYRKQVWESK